MPRRAVVKKRVTLPDAKYNNIMVSRLINKVMLNGKKSTAEAIVFKALELMEKAEGKEAITVLEAALRNVTPLLAVNPRRVGGATYQVPVEIRPGRNTALAIRWILKAAKARSGRSMAEKLAAEMVDAAKGLGAAGKKREEPHKMAEANRAFAHYRW